LRDPAPFLAVVEPDGEAAAAAMPDDDLLTELDELLLLLPLVLEGADEDAGVVVDRGARDDEVEKAGETAAAVATFAAEELEDALLAPAAAPLPLLQVVEVPAWIVTWSE